MSFVSAIVRTCSFCCCEAGVRSRNSMRFWRASIRSPKVLFSKNMLDGIGECCHWISSGASAVEHFLAQDGGFSKLFFLRIRMCRASMINSAHLVHSMRWVYSMGGWCTTAGIISKTSWQILRACVNPGPHGENINDFCFPWLPWGGGNVNDFCFPRPLWGETYMTWNFNVLDMAFKTIHIVQRLSRTPLLFSARSLTTTQNNNSRKSQIWKSGHPKTQVH